MLIIRQSDINMGLRDSSDGDIAMRYIAWVLCVVLLVGYSNKSFAQGWGFSAGVGVSQIRDRDDDGTFEGNGFAYIINGEYRFSENFALGAGFFSLGEDDDLVNSIDTNLDVGGVDLFLRGILPISENTDIYGRLGAAIYNVDSDPFSFNGLFGDDAFEVGVGLEFDGGESDYFVFRLEGLFLKGGSNESGGLLTAGFSYRF